MYILQLLWISLEDTDDFVGPIDQALVEGFRPKFLKNLLEYQFVFSVTDNLLPFEQITREPIFEDTRM